MKNRILALALLMWTSPTLAADFALTSTDVAAGKKLESAQVFNGFGCTGGNVSPHLAWSNPPAETKSFVITAYDPDAPTGSGWWHWIAYNIPANARSIGTGASRDTTKLPAGVVEGRTDYGTVGFGGACPPQGAAAHRYIFKITALKVEKLELPQDASAALIGYMTTMNAIGSAQIVALYGR
jgi:hypothetical protein